MQQGNVGDSVEYPTGATIDMGMVSRQPQAYLHTRQGSGRGNTDHTHSEHHEHHHISAIPKDNTHNQGGVGIVFVEGVQHGRLGVLTLTPNGPADRDGTVQVGDLISGVDGRDVATLPLAEVRRVIVGPPGTQVTLTMDRPKSSGHSASQYSVTLTRESQWEIQNRVKALEQRIMKIEEARVALQTELTASVEENTRLHERLQQKQGSTHEVTSLRQQLVSVTEQLRTVETEHRVLVDNHSRTQHIGGQQVTELQRQVKVLREENRSLQDALRQTETERETTASAERRAHQLQQALDSERENLRRVQSDVVSLNSELDRARQRAAEAEEESQRRRQTFRDEVDAAVAQLQGDARRSVDAERDRCTQLEAEVSRLQEAMEATSKDAALTRQQVAEEVEREARRIKQELARDHHEKSQRQRELQETLSQERARSSQLEQRLHTLQHEHSVTQEQIRMDVQSSITNARSKLDATTTELQRERELREQAESRLLSASSDVDDLTKQIMSERERRQQIEITAQHWATEGEKRVSLEAEVTKLRERLEALETDRLRAQEMATQYRETAEKAANSARQMEAENVSLRERCDKIELKRRSLEELAAHEVQEKKLVLEEQARMKEEFEREIYVLEDNHKVQLAKYQGRLRDYSAREDDLNRQVAAYRAQEEKLNALYSQLEHRSESQISVLVSENDEVTAKFRALQERERELVNMMHETERRYLEKIELERKSSQQLVEEAKMTIRTLEADVKRAHDQTRIVENEVNNAQLNHENAMREVNQLMAELEETRRSLRHEQQQRAELAAVHVEENHRLVRAHNEELHSIERSYRETLSAQDAALRSERRVRQQTGVPPQLGPRALLDSHMLKALAL